MLGTLNAVGDPDQRITFTSKRDDGVGGDDDGNGPSTGSPGDWDTLYVAGNATLEYVDVRYGAYYSAGHYTSPAGAMEPKSAIWVPQGGSVTINNSRITDNQQNGVGVGQGTANISYSLLARNTRGVSASRSLVAIDHTTIRANSNFGAYFYVNSATPSGSAINYSNVMRNRDYGVYVAPIVGPPAAAIPHGTQNNIFANRLDYRQLPADTNPTELNVSQRYSDTVNWNFNFWGSDVTYQPNEQSICLLNGRPGRLVHGEDYSVSETSQSFSGVPCPTDNLDPRNPSYDYIQNEAYDDYLSSDYKDLVDSYSPLLRYDTNEAFHVLSPGAITDFYDPNSILIDDSNSIKATPYDGERFAIADSRYVDPYPPGGLSPLNLAFLGSTYANPATAGWNDGAIADSDDLISARGSEDTTQLYPGDSLSQEPEHALQNYGRVTFGSDGRLWIQYWLFYYFNSRQPVHEGDWEMVQVGLNTVTLAPERAAYAQHTEGEWCPWSDVVADTNRPVVYVARDSHASYFGSTRVGHGDTADGSSNPNAPQPLPVTATNPRWMAWPGQWGDTNSLVAHSPAGPGHGGNAGLKWSDPGAWARNLTQCPPP